jgi:hypothetical protein
LPTVDNNGKAVEIISVDAAMNFYRDLRDVQAVLEHVTRLKALLEEIPSPLYAASCDASEGWLLARLGKIEEGLVQARRGFAAARGVFLFFTASVFADVCMQLNAVDEGLAATAAAEESYRHLDVGFRLPEVLRLKGELLLLKDASDFRAAELPLRQAIEVAARQNAKWWELRATASLARLLRDTGRRDEARTMLAEIYNWFTEGIDAADLKDAKALLDELKK